MSLRIAKIAVSAATYWIDRPYDYLIPQEMYESAVPGVRVFVPFSRGNRICEGIVLSVTQRSEIQNLKSIISVLDAYPVLSSEQLNLALFIRERFFCTVYDAVKSMLPAGLWFKDDGKKRVSDKTIEMARLLVSSEEAYQIAETKKHRSKQQSAILEMLCGFETLPVKDLLTHTGARRPSLNALCDCELVELYRREVFRRCTDYVDELEPLPILNDEQKAAFDGINRLALSDRAEAALLFGVTGSGKTSVYAHIIREVLTRGKTAILLVPEIALTPQMLHTFSSYFGEEIAVLHSSLSMGERYDEWKRIKNGKAHVVIGTRSAIFAPLEDLGVIIIDEEQEESYKSENNPRYNARDVAKYRCFKAGCLLLLGSATPDIVSRYNAQEGKYSFFALKNRYNDMHLPKVSIVDMKRELRRGNGGNISSFLREELQANIDAGEQSILFINRRGANKLVSCGACGFIYKCPRCSVSLTYHSANERLMCHYCGYSRRLDKSCPECGGEFSRVGAGTQLVEEELHQLFPEIQVLRMDTDSVAPVGSHELLFEKFRNENIPIMVGTQMVTKGLNFENVTLVGVISADQSLYAGDYRAGERSFSLITQVIGRSGRGSKPGRAVIQTFTPENETIAQASRQDYEEFYLSEIQLRSIQGTPPFNDLIAVTASGAEEHLVVQACREIRDYLEENLKDSENALVFGPTPLSVVRVNNRYRYRTNLRCKADSGIRKLVSQCLVIFNTDKRFKGVRIYADNDPSD